MKECAVCGEKLDQHAIRCSRGHSLFRSPRGVVASINKEEDFISEMLRQSSAGYTESEITYLIKEISKICRDNNTPISKQLVDTISKNLKKEEEQRQEAERRRREADQVRRRTEAEQRSRREREIESALHLIRGAPERTGEFVERKDLVKLLADALNLVIYNDSHFLGMESTLDHTYADNRNFWNDALHGNLVQGMRIDLQGFHVTQWLPSAPGRYYTAGAVQSRERAQSYLRHDNNLEYLPLGKGLMVLGGVGSVRLGARSINSETVYPLGASSTGASHQGIPIMIAEREYRRLIPHLQQGGCLANITGFLQIIPTRELLIRYDRQIPKYILFVDRLEVIQASRRLLVTVAITFSARSSHSSRHGRNDKKWAFCSFDPTRQKVHSASEWLEQYVHRYSEDGEILSDFDEHYEHFYRHNIDFPVSQVVKGNIDFDKVGEYREDYNFEVNINVQELIMGNTYSNSGQVGAMGDGARSDNNIFSQNIDQNFHEVTKLINSLRDIAKAFPEDKRDEVLLHLDDLHDDITNPEKKTPQRIKTRLVALALAVGTIASGVAGVVDFSNNILDLSEKLGVQLELPKPKSSQQLPSSGSQ